MSLMSRQQRANGEVNPVYIGTHVFTNDFGALNEQTIDENTEHLGDLFNAQPATGECRVVCFAPEHNKSLPELKPRTIIKSR